MNASSFAKVDEIVEGVRALNGASVIKADGHELVNGGLTDTEMRRVLYALVDYKTKAVKGMLPELEDATVNYVAARKLRRHLEGKSSKRRPNAEGIHDAREKEQGGYNILDSMQNKQRGKQAKLQDLRSYAYSIRHDRPDRSDKYLRQATKHELLPEILFKDQSEMSQPHTLASSSL